MGKGIIEESRTFSPPPPSYSSIQSNYFVEKYSKYFLTKRSKYENKQPRTLKKSSIVRKNEFGKKKEEKKKKKKNEGKVRNVQAMYKRNRASIGKNFRKLPLIANDETVKTPFTISLSLSLSQLFATLVVVTSLYSRGGGREIGGSLSRGQQ